MRNILACSLLAVAVASPFAAAGRPSKADNRAAVQALEDQFAAAVRARDIDAIMRVYAPGQDLFVFDLVPPRQYVGADAYRKDWKSFLDSFKGPIKFAVSDLSVDAGGKIAYSHSIQHISGTDTKGKAVALTVRVTDVYRRFGSEWLIVHEHVSVPVNVETGKPDMSSAP